MKANENPRRPWQGVFCCSLLLLGFAFNSFSQTGVLPVVTIQATDPFASWSGDTGTFTLFRAGPTNATLMVYCRIGGTASNGVDYAMISSYVTIPAGARTSTVTISPINNGQTNTETVVLTLAPSPAVPPVNYIIGNPSNAVVYISPTTVTNIPPWVYITSPANGAVFYTPVNIGLVALAGDPDGFVTSVEFFAGTNSLGVVTNFAVVDPLPGGGPPPGTRAFFLTWSNVQTGTYALSAKATDDGGASTVSALVKITVNPGPPPPPTNIPPLVRIISPPNGAVFHAPVNVPIYGFATDPDGYVVSVEFFAGTNSLGLGHGVCLAASPSIYCPTNIYFLIWSNAPLGQYALTAKATDNGGASTVSAPPVNVTILPSPPPPTNRPPVVSIVAIDPIAIEGTNCWPWLGLTNPVPTWSNWLGATPICRFFTNCGPKNATFLVRRFGDTNDPITVTYAIGGTATNGVDYVTLPGSVLIPAGQRSASISVVPLDDGPPDLNSTVILTLQPSTNTPPDYLVGFPPRAAALILEHFWPPPIAAVLPDQCFHLSAAGPDGAWFDVEYSTDLVNWTAICTNQVINGSIDFIDPDAPANPTRFYRAVPEASPPLQ